MLFVQKLFIFFIYLFVSFYENIFFFQRNRHVINVSILIKKRMLFDEIYCNSANYAKKTFSLRKMKSKTKHELLLPESTIKLP